MLRNYRALFNYKLDLFFNKNLFAIPQRVPSLNITPFSNVSPNFNIEHDVKRQKFRVNLDPDNEAFINYEHLGSNEVLLYHTEVPEKFRQSGVGRILAHEAFKHFEDTKQKMVITCTYLQKMNNELKNVK